MTSSYGRVTGLADLFAKARELSVKTMIFDVEPLVAPWRGSQESLDQGIARTLGDARTVPSVRVVVFATNSARRPTAVPASDGLQVSYLASAFLHYAPELAGVPLGPGLMHRWGELVRPVLFRRPVT